MKALITIAIVLTVLVGCDRSQQPVVDQCLRAERFRECMELLPAGPQSTQYNDWDDVVDSCESAAYHQSIRPRGLIRAECRSGA